MLNVSLFLTLAMFLLTFINAQSIRIPRNGRDLSASVAVLLPVRNEAANIVDLVASLKAQTGISDLKFYFLDDDSEDDSFYVDESDDHDVDMKLAGDMIEGLFTESKVDSILKGYFKVEGNEKRLIESKKRQTKLISENKKTKINKIKQLSESISQEVGARKLIEKYPNAKLVGKTNKQNLVFEMNDEQLRVNTKGQIV